MSEKVLRIHTSGHHDGVHQIILQNIWNPDTRGHIPNLTHVIQNCMFEVYTAAEVDQQREGLRNWVASLREESTGSGGIIDQRVEAASNKLKEEVVRTIDELPQRLISAEAIEMLKEAVIAKVDEKLSHLKEDIDEKLDDLRQEMQARIDELRRS